MRAATPEDIHRVVSEGPDRGATTQMLAEWSALKIVKQQVFEKLGMLPIKVVAEGFSKTFLCNMKKDIEKCLRPKIESRTKFKNMEFYPVSWAYRLFMNDQHDKMILQ
eukprot:Platyproteum_vivax@DN7945_c0_g1_i1.p1